MKELSKSVGDEVSEKVRCKVNNERYFKGPNTHVGHFAHLLNAIGEHVFLDLTGRQLSPLNR